MRNFIFFSLAVLSFSLLANAGKLFKTTVTLDTVGVSTTLASDSSASYVVINTRRDKPVYVKKSLINIGSQDRLTVTDVTNSKTYTFTGTSASGPGVSGNSEAVEGLEFLDAEEIHVAYVKGSAVGANRGFALDVSLEQCALSQFACDNGDGCYTPSQACDGVSQCFDGSDESSVYCTPECGKPHFPLKETNRIVGGQYATRHSLPWQAGTPGPGCGGTIINDQWVLTAAHCFRNGVAGPGQTLGQLRLGGHDKSKTPEQDRAVMVDIVKIICHPQYSSASTSGYDQCLLKLKEKIPFRKNIVPACLPVQGENPVTGEQCMTSGWGNTQAINTQILKQVYVPVVDWQECKNAYPTLTDTMLCAGVVQGGIDSCQGDSGGPFICKNGSDRWTVNGIVSWGRGCALPNFPGVYASTGSVQDWIDQTIATQ